MSRLLLLKSGSIIVPSGAAETQPDAVTGLQGWWKADAGTLQSAGGAAATADGDPVGEWRDQSGNGRHWQISATARPTLKTGANGINGVNVLQFDNVDDNMSSTGIGFTVDSLIAAGDYCFFAVIQPNAGDTNTGTAWTNDALVSDSNGVIGLHFTSAPNLYAYNWDGTADTVPISHVAATVYGIRQRHTGGTLYLLRSGTTESSTASGDTTPLSGNLRLGADGTTATRFYDGKLGELFFYDAQPSAAELDGLAQYLATKWGLTW